MKRETFISRNAGPERQINPQLERDIRALVGRIYLPSVHADALNPDALSEAIAQTVRNYYGTPKTGKADLARVSNAVYESVVLIEKPVTRQRVKSMQRRVRKLWAWSATDLAKWFGVSRGQIKHIQSGTRSITPGFELKFRLLERRLLAWQKENRLQAKELTIVTGQHHLPSRVEILAKPIRCDRCKHYFIPVTANQKRHKNCQAKL